MDGIDQFDGKDNRISRCWAATKLAKLEEFAPNSNFWGNENSD